MSADEFDPYVERLFGQSPSLADNVHFAATVEQRLDKGTRMRTLTLALAGLIGGVIAVRETVGSNFNFDGSRTSETVQIADRGVGIVTSQAQTAVQSGLTDLGLAMDLSSMGGMQMFWVASAVLVAAAVMAASKLIQDV